MDDCVKDVLPKDEQTCDDYGFSRCTDFRKRSHLLGLYKGVLVYQNVSPVQLDAWRQENTLAHNIVESFSSIPESHRGAYYKWFVKNQGIVDSSLPPAPADQGNYLQRVIDAARPHLDSKERSLNIRDFQPQEKGYCFIFYAMALDSSHPNPHWVELDLWYDFGFAVCQDEYYEGNLGGLYNRLVGGNKSSKDYDKSLSFSEDHWPKMPDLPTCSFEEFWTAWRDGTMGKLFRKCNVSHGVCKDPDHGDYEDKIPRPLENFQEFMSYPLELHGLRPSIWRIRHLLALEYSTPLRGYPGIEQAAKEYGFTPQIDARTKLALYQFYKKLLDHHDQLDVHMARFEGQLLEYTENVLDVIDDSVREVLQTLGPMETTILELRP